MINKDRWINSLNYSKAPSINDSNSIDGQKWLNTISKKNTFSSVKKYSFLSVLFVCSLLFVSAIKNETRNLQRDIDQLKASNNIIKFNLDQANLDHEVITSPENVYFLANEYLDTEFKAYKKSQIKNFGEKIETLNKITKIQAGTEKNKIDKLPKKLKLQVVKKIQKKKMEIRKLQELYSNPKSLPTEVKKQVAKKIEKKKFELKNIYDSPKEFITAKRVTRWGAVQVVKAFLGMPFIPGR